MTVTVCDKCGNTIDKRTAWTLWIINEDATQSESHDLCQACAMRMRRVIGKFECYEDE